MTMIARLEVTRGDLVEYPLAERTKGGWQNGVTFYPDADVTKVTPLTLVREEWEYGIRAKDDAEPYSDISDDLDWLLDGFGSSGDRDDEIVRRRKAGPWTALTPDGQEKNR